jgi:hypothetical protein
MSFRIVCLTACFGAFLSSIAFADDSAERAKLTGTWQSSQGEKGVATKAVWILESQGDAIHIINSQGDKKIAEYACALGKECEVKDGGRKVKVTLFFNGSKLVLLETRGDQVVKRLFATAQTGDILDLDVIPMTPDGKTETLHFQRVLAAGSGAH